MKYTNQQGHFTAHDGAKLFHQSWIQPQETKQHLVIHHGLGEHSGRYNHLLEAFSDNNWNIHSFDARGHGHSEGKRGLAGGLDEFTTDLEFFLEHLNKKHKISQPILLGHSLGGLVVAGFAVKNDNQKKISALVMSAAALRVPLTPDLKIKKFIGTLLAHLFPKMTLTNGIDPALISHDTQVVEAYKNDPLVHPRIGAALAVELLAIGDSIQNQAAKLSIPLYMAHGENDQITDPAGSTEFFNRCASPDKTLKIYPKLYHEIFNETFNERQQVLLDLKLWLTKRFS